MIATNGAAKNGQRDYTRADWTDFAHTGPGTLAGRFMRSFWQPVRRVQDLKAGQAVPLTIMSEQFTLYRGEDGAPHLLDFRCAHRGTQLSTGWVEGDHLRCFYHGWVYDGQGQCVDQPAEPEPFCQRIKIKSYPVQEYLGLVFAYLGEGEAPPITRYPELEADGVLENGFTAAWPCNYFNRLENSPDPVHLAFVHRTSPFTDSGLIGVPEVSGHETEYGIEVHARRPNSQVRVTHFHMPNINLIANSDTEGFAGRSLNLSWRIPIDDEHTISFAATHLPLTGQAAEAYRAERTARRGKAATLPGVYAEQILRGELTVDEVEERANIVNVEDYVAQVGQSAIAPRELDHLGHSDVLVILLRNLWERELRALAEGQPLKQWHRPERVEVAYGA